MNIPRFWANASETIETDDGRSLFLKGWGWSLDSLSEAQNRARETLQRLTARVRSGENFPDRYAYGTRALREEIIREISASINSSAAIVTRNSYGALILNTTQMMFVDIDVPIDAPPSSSGLLSLFSRKKQPQGPDPAEQAFETLKSRLGVEAGRFRAYRTAGGFRLIAVDALYEPGSTETEEFMNYVQADPAFIKLCRAQKSFRARLTPKPWRIRQSQPPVSFPRETSREQHRFSKWLSNYETASAAWATCKLLLEAKESIHKAIQPLLDIHDEITKVSSSLPLA